MEPPLPLEHLPLSLRPDASRVLVRPFMPAGAHGGGASASRALKILTRVLALSDDEVNSLLRGVMEDFGDRHKSILQIFEERFQEVARHLPTDRPVSPRRRHLIGSYFTSEYSLESAALFNPSIVPHPDQSGLAEGAVRIILSLRATGEGHISSITFRSGVLDAGCDLVLDPASRFVSEPHPVENALYDRDIFNRKLIELGISSDYCHKITSTLGEQFTLAELKAAIDFQKRHYTDEANHAAGDRIIAVARSNYETEFEAARPMSERIIFPFSPSQSNGIEDARFVLFRHEGTSCYYATYTAYDGRMVLPQIMETEDFTRFRVRTLNGAAVENKGMALFPRKVGGRYCMLSRQDSENIRLMYSDHLHFWHESQVISRPTEPWEFVQLGNCGSPIETPEGWLVLTHGVGPMRKYCIGAMLLDLEDPAKVIGKLREPLIRPAPEDREGYVPNVVYTCGAMVHGKWLVIPYAISDTVTKFARIDLATLIAAMR